MATVSKSPPETAQDAVPTRADSFLLEGVSWETYESLHRDFERTGSQMRMTYDRGSLEFMSPVDILHEWPKKLIGRMIECVTEELRIFMRSAGSITIKTQLKQRGLEPDECYWITHVASVRGKKKLDLDLVPPPDLAVEIEHTRKILDRLPVYAGLGVPEIWRLTASGAMSIGRLQADGTYAWGDRSVELPFLTTTDMLRWLQEAEIQDETDWIASFRAWVRAELVPQHRRPGPDPAG